MITRSKIFVLSLCAVLIIFAFIGCGDTDGGAGRRVERGELVPFNPFQEDTVVTGSESVDTLIENGWTLYSIGEYSNAASTFSSLAARSDLNTRQRTDVLVGQGMSLFRSQGPDAALTPLNEAVSLSPSNADAKVALAAAIIQSNSNRDLARAVSLMEDVGLYNTGFTYNQERRIGISNAEAHALLALGYWLRNQSGDRSAAKGQINAARAADSSNDSSVAQIDATLRMFGIDDI